MANTTGPSVADPDVDNGDSNAQDKSHSNNRASNQRRRIPSQGQLKSTRVCLEDGKSLVILEQLGTKAKGMLRKLNPKVLLCQCVTLPLLTLMYTVINAAGIRYQLPMFGLRLYKLPVPGASYLRKFHATYTLDLAYVFALFLMCAVYIMTLTMMRLHLSGDTRSRPKGIEIRKFRRMVFLLGAFLLLGDVILFYGGVSHHAGSWGVTSPFISLIASAVYLAVLGFVAFVHVTLEIESQN